LPLRIRRIRPKMIRNGPGDNQCTQLCHTKKQPGMGRNSIGAGLELGGESVVN
jgi:hypothetical protein